MKIIKLDQNSPAWLAWRQEGIGASDISIIVGSNPYKTALQLWEEKCGFGSSDSSVTDAMLFGIKNEGKARDWINKNYKYFFEPCCIEDKETNYFRASLDGFDKKQNVILEIKCPSSERIIKEVKEEKTFPQYWIDQVQWQFIVSKATSAYLGVWDWKENGCIISEIHPDVERQAKLVKEAKKFWDMVKNGIAPEPSDKDYVTVEDPKLKIFIKHYKEADSQEKNLKKIKKGIKDKIIEFGDDGNFMAYGVKVKRCPPRSCYDIEKMRDDGIDVEKYKVQKQSIGYYKIILPRETI